MEEVILVCDHVPRTNWTDLGKGEVVATLETGEQVPVNAIALCDECFMLPQYELRVHVVRWERAA